MQSSVISIFLAYRNKFQSPENKKARFKNEVGTFCDPLRSGEPNKWLIPSIAPHFAMQSSGFSIFLAYRNKFQSPENKKARFKNEVGTFCDPLRIRTVNIYSVDIKCYNHSIYLFRVLIRVLK